MPGQWHRIHSLGFLRTGPAPPDDETVWVGFGLAAQQAAKAAGFPKGLPAQLVAALGELHSNIYEHSEASGTGLIAFRAEKNQFEFTVTDQGIGLLESLRKFKNHERLDDHGDALRLALMDGVSRHGSDTRDASVGYVGASEDVTYTLKMAYQRQHLPIVSKRLKQAGVRLGEALNKALGN